MPSAGDGNPSIGVAAVTAAGQPMPGQAGGRGSSLPRFGRLARGRIAGLAALTLAVSGGAPGSAPASWAQTPVAAYRVVGDAIPQPLEGRRGDAARGRNLVLDRRVGNCLICHQVPVVEEPFQGNLGPDLSGVGQRLSEGQIRLRLVDQSRVNPHTIMPPYHRVEGLVRVAAPFAGRPVLDAQQIEDVVAWLAGLK